MTDGIRRRWRTLSPRTRALLLVHAAGFLEGTGTHAADLAQRGLHAYSSYALPAQVFFVALIVLDPLVAVLVLGARPVGVPLAVAVMAADAFANWFVNWSWLCADWSRLLRPVGLLPITLFALFVLATSRPLWRALSADPAVAWAPPIREDAPDGPPKGRTDHGSQPRRNGAHR
ncbi:hypothetical protein [Streptomyces misionensis]|uniref:hypothetical protein n=1 Tax=Streptomyces misionensis TaxID=67331 RepID=UPI00164439B6|nr:hypothetical protein [Streptomyces misionensis]